MASGLARTSFLLLPWVPHPCPGSIPFPPLLPSPQISPIHRALLQEKDLEVGPNPSCELPLGCIPLCCPWGAAAPRGCQTRSWSWQPRRASPGWLDAVLCSAPCAPGP